MADQNINEVQNAEPAGQPAQKAIVSVNSRGGTSNNLAGKIIFFVVCFAILAVGAFAGYNKWRSISKEKQAATEQASKSENKSALVGHRRSFEDETPPPLPSGAVKTDANSLATNPTATSAMGTCVDGSEGIIMLGQDGKPLMSPSGMPMRVCKDGKVVVPAINPSAPMNAQPIGVAGNSTSNNQAQYQQTNGVAKPSRFGGDIAIESPLVSTAMAMQPQMQPMQGSGLAPAKSSPEASTAQPSGSVGSMLQPSSTPSVTATMLGDRNMIIPQGRSIDCNLSMKLVSEVAGFATCVLSQNVYSDNGNVVLLERGSEAFGEYKSDVQQGQKRIFVLWSRVKTPSGVIININSPAADGLGTGGLEGYVDNHWWERIGAAFLLSVVQDVVSGATAPSSSGNGTSVSIFSNSTQTTKRMSETVLNNTINIKPTLYKNQGDRGTIFVARDLDFGSVYAIKAH